uniref:cysteine dioxygenase n=1 Tax=Oryza sativa subsp. japonica TaxID=39947 RepID=Q6Z1W7_ORYSJ|nr:HGWP repeat containing protein-like [Oryza sativa Japonica Group]BAD17331.1 HGWP repeat containing protein-like [Oryza sativa Japonica Group]
MGVHIFTDRLAFVTADWCSHLHGWLVTPLFMGVHVFTDRLAFTAVDWCLRLHGWPIMPPLLGVYDFTAGLPPSPPTGVLAYTVGMDQSEHHHRLAFAAADWCHRLHGWPIMPLLFGVNVFTDRSSRPPPTGVTASTAGLLCRRCWASTSSPTGRLIRRRLVSPPKRLEYYAAVVGRLRLHRPAASSAADLCFHLHSWHIMPPLLGVYVFTDRPPRPPPTGVSVYTVGLLCCCCWASTSSPTDRLVHRRLVSPHARLAYYAAVVGRLRLHRPAASSAADWCLRLHGWHIMPPLLGVYVFTDWPPRPPPTGVSVYTVGLLCRCCWASTSSPIGLLVRRRLVSPPIRLAYYAAVVGRLRLHQPAASSAADWCFRLHSWPIMPPLLGVYIFTDQLPRPPPTGVSAYTAGILCRCCWASTSSPTGRLVRRRLVFPPTRLAYYAAVVGRLRLHRPAASFAADWCFRLHSWPIMLPLLGVYVFTDQPPCPPPTGVSVYTAGLLCRRC